MNSMAPTIYTVTTYGCREYLCRIGMISGAIETVAVPVPGPPLIREIQETVAGYYHVRAAEMTSARRTRDVARPRQVAMYLSKRLTPRSLPEIGRRFGGRDHTTVIHAVRQITKLRASDRELDHDVRLIEAQFASGGRHG